MGKKWLPLESNPEVMTEFASRIGLDTGKHAFYDVYSLDEELLAMVPQPVLAVLLLFPITPATEAAAKAADAAAAASGGGNTAAAAAAPADLYYMKQTIGNACGTIAMLHAFGNNANQLGIEPGSFLERFFAATRPLDAAARGAYLEQPPSGAPDIEDAHRAAGEAGDTAAPRPEDEVDLHFVAFVAGSDGRLYELDGRRAGPVPHGPTSPDTLLADTARVVRAEYIEKSASLNFNLICLSAADA